MGSLIAAVGSYLDAKSRHGTWLVRMEDLDTPRCVPGAADNILNTLTNFGLISDEQTCIKFTDRLQGQFAQNLACDAGDFLLKRADGLFAYQLAVVVDDAEQQISDVVRGADLLDSTLRQIYLQQLLHLNTPTYMHFPVAVNQQGEKLSKQTRARAVEPDNAAATLCKVLEFLGQSPPASLRKKTALLAWAVDNWRPEILSGHRQRTV